MKTPRSRWLLRASNQAIYLVIKQDRIPNMSPTWTLGLWHIYNW